MEKCCVVLRYELKFYMFYAFFALRARNERIQGRPCQSVRMIQLREPLDGFGWNVEVVQDPTTVRVLHRTTIILLTVSVDPSSVTRVNVSRDNKLISNIATHKLSFTKKNWNTVPSYYSIRILYIYNKGSYIFNIYKTCNKTGIAARVLKIVLFPCNIMEAAVLVHY
jgi:hypothetical protein